MQIGFLNRINQKLPKLGSSIICYRAISAKSAIVNDSYNGLTYLANKSKGSIQKLKTTIVNSAKNTAIYKGINKISKSHYAEISEHDIDKLLDDFMTYKTTQGENLYCNLKTKLATIVRTSPKKLSDKMPEYCYHGTSNNGAESILNSGFNISNQSNLMGNLCRDLGKGVYLTPDKKIAKDFGTKILTVKFDTSKIGYIDHQDWSIYYNKLETAMNNYASEKKLTRVQINGLQNNMFAHFVKGLEVGNCKTKIGGLSVNGMLDFFDISGLRNYFKVPTFGKPQVAIYDTTIIKEIKQ